MRLLSIVSSGCQRLLYCGLFIATISTNAPAQSNVTVRVMAANTSSGSNQRYETPGLNIFKGLKPDLVCIQEFNYASTNGLGISTPAAMREMIDATFGTNYSYFRETNSGYSIPNGIISRYPIITNGSWVDSDTGVNDRGFAWALIDLPGTNDLYAVSIHLKASSGSDNPARRAAEAAELKTLIQASFPSNAWIVVGGDLNTYDQSEACMTTFTSFLSDRMAPADQNGGTNTNAGRSERYDRVMASFSFTNTQIPVVVGTNTFTNGLVFDSRVTPYLQDVSPVQPTDSGVTGMQHMAIVKDFRYAISVSNPVVVTPPYLYMSTASILRWAGVSNATYSVQTKTNLAATNWLTLATASSTTTNFSYTNASAGTGQRFYRVSYP
ncbi:MAG TPA: endonuclease/exonuclease/phosphatase family protein [bacterium]|nr:endonuclease/exonuclease/phosphatase family protein [bacterium]